MLRYKACRNSIVTLELLNDSVTNEKRDGVVDDRYAKFRCNMARVVNIRNVKTGEMMKKDVSIWNDGFRYFSGEIAETGFDKNPDKICASGIHYFKTREAAVSWFYRQDDEYFLDGKFIQWHENGEKESEGTFKDGKFDGKWTIWHENGQKHCEGTYKNKHRDGKWIWWESNGNKQSEETFKDGKKDGKRTEWWGNGHKRSEGIYKNGEKDGEWAYWYNNGQRIKTSRAIRKTSHLDE